MVVGIMKTFKKLYRNNHVLNNIFRINDLFQLPDINTNIAKARFINIKNNKTY